MERLSLAAVNGMDRDAFVAALGWIFEGSPWVAQRAYAARPFDSVDALHRAMLAAVEEASEEEQCALLVAHPDLAARIRLSPASASEQAGAGLDRLSPEQFERFSALNRLYRERFGFPFVIAVREHTTESILAAFERRLAHSREEELRTALEQVGWIAAYRLQEAFA